MSFMENAFKATKGNMSLTTGTFNAEEQSSVWFNVGADIGELKITWNDDTFTNSTFPIGGAKQFEIKAFKTVQIISGTFDKA